MIIITIFQNQESITGFRCLGHAEYAEYGSDIICAGVSALVVNAINSIEAMTDTEYDLKTDEETGLVDFKLKDEADHDTSVLLLSMVLGLQGIQTNYGNEFLTIDFKEV